MPPDHRVGLDEHERRTPPPPRLGQDDPRQAISPPETRTCARAFHSVELLSKGDILNDQFVVSTTGQRQRPDQHRDYLQHTSILLFYAGRINPARPVLNLANYSRPET